MEHYRKCKRDPNVPYYEVVDGDSLPWKLAGWGSAKDKKILSSVTARFPTLRKIEQRGQVSISEGMQLRTESSHSGRDKLERHPELAGKAILDVKRLKGRRDLFHLPADALERVPADRVYVRMRGGLNGLWKFARHRTFSLEPHEPLPFTAICSWWFSRARSEYLAANKTQNS